MQNLIMPEGNPNRQLLEEKLAKLEGGQYAFAYASGIITISAVLLTLKQMITSFFLMMYTVVHSDLQNKF